MPFLSDVVDVVVVVVVVEVVVVVAGTAWWQVGICLSKGSKAYWWQNINKVLV